MHGRRERLTQAGTGKLGKLGNLTEQCWDFLLHIPNPGVTAGAERADGTLQPGRRRFHHLHYKSAQNSPSCLLFSESLDSATYLISLKDVESKLLLNRPPPEATEDAHA